MDDLISFLRSAQDARLRQLDDDERIAAAAADGDPAWTIQRPEPGDPSWHSPTLLGKSLISSCDPATLTPEEGEHIARWDPARVLAEIDRERKRIEAERQVLELYDYAVRRQPDNDEKAGRLDALRAAIGALAQPYAGHPDWREEWTA